MLQCKKYLPPLTHHLVTLSYHLCISSWRRLHAGHGALPARADPPPHPVSVWQEGLGALHCLLDTESLCTLGGLPTPRLLPQATYDRASEANPGRQQEGAGGRLQVGDFTLTLTPLLHVWIWWQSQLIDATMIHFVPIFFSDPHAVFIIPRPVELDVFIKY